MSAEPAFAQAGLAEVLEAKFFFRKRNENFANETILFRLGCDKPLKSLGAKWRDFAIFNVFNALWAI